MSERRADHHGWRKQLRDYGFVVAIFMAGTGWGQSVVAGEERDKKIQEVRTLQGDIAKLLRRQAETNGRVAVSLDTLTAQYQEIQKRLWEIKEKQK